MIHVDRMATSHRAVLRVESLEGRRLQSSGIDDPGPVAQADFSEATPTPAAPSSLYDLANDPLLSQVLYSTPRRMASGIADSGAVGVNATWEAGQATTWYIEQQRYGADFVQAGLVRGDASLAAHGWKILDWGFARQASDGSFAGTGDAFHSTSMFVEAAARALLLEQQSGSGGSAAHLQSYGPKLEAAARWLTRADVAAKGDQYDAPYTHRRWILSAALGETAAVLRGGPATEAQLAFASNLEQRAASYARRGLALQTNDGINPENGGSDTSYQAYGSLMAERYCATCRSAADRDDVRAMIVRGLDWLSTKIDASGAVSTEDDARTGMEASRSGTIKTIDYKTMIQAFSVAATLTGNASYRTVARNLASGRGWST